MTGDAVVALAEVLAHVSDPRKRRGVRHPFHSILMLVFLGLTARIREMEVLVRWAQANWELLREPLGFTRDQPPVATTISRAMAGCSLAEFSAAFVQWLKRVLPDDQPLDVAVDGKTSRQGYDANGHPVQMLNVMVQRLKLVLAQWPIGSEKTNEPGVLRNHLNELLAAFPMLRLISGDAIFAQRPLAELFDQSSCDYLLQVKSNQPELLAALQQSLGQVEKQRPPAAETVETNKKRGAGIVDVFGLI